MVLPPCSTVSGHMWAKKFGLNGIHNSTANEEIFHGGHQAMVVGAIWGGYFTPENSLSWYTCNIYHQFTLYVIGILQWSECCQESHWFTRFYCCYYCLLLFSEPLLFTWLSWFLRFWHLYPLYTQEMLYSFQAPQSLWLESHSITVCKPRDMGEWDGPECCHFFRTQSHDWRKWAYAVPMVDLCDVKSLSLVAFTWCKASWSASTFPLKKTWRSCWLWDC